MAINTTTRQTTAFTSGNNFAFDFKVYEEGDVKVIQIQTSNGAETVLTITTHYTVTLNDDQDANPGGTVTLVSSGSPQNLASGYNIVITSKVSALQQTEITNQGGFFPEVINDVLDKAVILSQQQQNILDKTIRLPLTQSVSGLEITENAATRAGKSFRFDSSGNLELFSPTSVLEFTQTEKDKLAAIEASATADQTAAEIRTLVESATDSNVFTDADHTKLNAIEANADVTDATNVNAAGAVMNSDTDITSMQFVVDEDNMSSNSATKIPTQQSVKAYVDNEISGIFQGDITAVTAGTGLSGGGTVGGVTLNIDSTVATLTGSQTLTNKTINVDDNTISNIEVDNFKSGVLDTNLNSVSVSDDTLASAKAIKAYVDANAGGTNLASGGTINGDLTLTGANYNVVWDKSDNALEFADLAKLTFGNGGDLEIYHNSNNNASYINETGSGSLVITAENFDVQDNNGNSYLLGVHDGALQMYHHGDARLLTTSTGIAVFSGASGSETQNGSISSGNIEVTGNITVTGTVDGVDIATRDSLFGGLTSSSGVLSNGVTATTQTAGDNTTKVATTAFVSTAVSNLVDSAPSALNTLNELAAALGDDANFSTTVTNSIGTKMPLAGGQFTGNITFSGSQTVDGRDLSVDGAKLDGIESGATADQTAAEIRTLVESASDSNVFTDADHTKLNAIEASATADQTDAEIKTAYENNSDTNAFTDSEKTKLSGIETSADVTDATNVDAAGAVMNSDLDGKGELLVGDGSGDPTVLAAGTNGYVLKANSSTATGLEWAAAGAGGDVNQNAFSNVAVSGQTTVAADSATDTLNIAAGSNVTITTNASNDTVTIASTDTNTTYSVGDGGLTQNNFTDALKTKLDGVEASADVTDATNVASAGAVMDGDFTSNGFMKRTGAGTYTVDTNTYLTSVPSGYLQNLSEDTTPQLGGDLDMNSKFISSGILGIKNQGSQSELRLYCESSNAHYASLKAPAHADFSGDITFTLPSGYGSNGQVLQSNGSGGTSWVAQTTAYTNSNVDSHLNTSSASSGQILSWNGSDYAWVADQTGGGGGGSSTLTIQDEGSALSTAATTLNFVGGGVVASGTGATKTITISGTSTSLDFVEIMMFT